MSLNLPLAIAASGEARSINLTAIDRVIVTICALVIFSPWDFRPPANSMR